MPYSKEEKRNCECCYASYTFGRMYETYICYIPIRDSAGEHGNYKIRNPQGICPWCNKNSYMYVENLKCHHTAKN
jgi:hypothetical protein